jgi:predicted transposase/invertase (TIGR01784 family)
MDTVLYKSRYINPMVDVGFKLIFGQEKHKRLIKELLEHVFEVRITELSYANVERLSSVADRNACFDLMCRAERVGDFIVEVQVREQKNFIDRALFYSTFPIIAQAPKGEWDYGLAPVYFLGLLNFSLPTASAKESGCVHRYSLRNDETHGLLTESVKYVFLEVGPFVKREEECKSFIEKFLYYMKNLPTFAEKPQTQGEGYFEELLEAAEYAALDTEMKAWYDERLKVMRDNKNTMDFAIEKGHKEGLEKGLAEGLEKGIQQGLQQGIQQGLQQGVQQGIQQGQTQKSREIARNLLSMGLSAGQVSEGTGLSLDEVLELRSAGQ